MSIYNYLRCEYPLPGLKDPTSIEFQTKSLDDGFFDLYRLTPEGKLEIEEYDVEDRSDRDAEGIMQLAGCFTRVAKGWTSVDFSGNLNFYGDANSGSLFLISKDRVSILDEEGRETTVPPAEWFEYNAVLEHGILLSLERVE